MVGLANAQTDRQFWFVAPAITASHAGETPIYFRVTAGSLDANVIISMPANAAAFHGGSPITQFVSAGSTVTINVSADVINIENNYEFLDGVFGKNNKGIYIQSDNPITVYYEDGMTNNCDIFALKGKNALGTEFYTVFQNMGYNMSKYDAAHLTDPNKTWTEPAYSAIDIVATEDGTVVTVESPLASQHLYHYGIDNFSVTLNKGETFSITPDWITNVPINDGTCATGRYPTDYFFGRAGADHLGGLHITSNANHPIAITKKDDSVRHKCVNQLPEGDTWPGGCFDLIGDQMVPLSILGKEYIAMKGGLHRLGYAGDDNEAPENVYCVATADNTVIDTNNVYATTINRGQTYVYELWRSPLNSVHIRGSEKLSVLHVSGFGCEVGGAILPPIDKCTGSTKVSVNRTTTESFFINLMVWDGAEDGFYINGIAQNVDGGDPANGVLFGPADFQAVPGTSNWKIWRSNALPTKLLPLGSFPAGGTFTFENTKDVFHLGIINGGGSSGCRFGYFSDFNELKVDAQATGSLSSSIRACSYEKIQLYAKGGTDYNWWPIQYLDDPTSSIPIANPPSDTTLLFYVEVSGACGLTDTATVSVEKFPELESQFSIDQGFGCSPLSLTLHEVSTKVKERFWDFNFTNINGSPDRDTIVYGGTLNFDTDTTFTHWFFNTSNEPIDSAQNYNIRLLVKNTNDCSDTSWASVTVYPEVTADFSISVPADTIGCSPHFIQFIDNSNNEDAYAWRFGDGVSNFTANPSHSFLNITNNDTVYTTRLVARSNFFCRDTVYLNFTIHPYIEAGFTISTFEGCSPLDVTISNTSVFEDSIILKYGDGSPNYNVNTFNQVTHRYKNNGTTVLKFPIELLALNDEGCFEIWTDTIIVYPEFKAKYTIDGPGNYIGCNTRDVTFTNTTPQGTHIANQFLWTFGDGATLSTTNVSVPHTYNNTTNADKIYNFNLHAESQYGCFDDTTYQIRINRALADFTVDDDKGCSPLPVTITNTSIGNNITTWAWSFGDGVNDPNKFPAINPHIYNNITGLTQNRYLRLTVTGTNGCSTFKQDTIDVYSSINLTFTPATDQIGCDSLIIPFNSTSVPNIVGTTYQWTFGDGTSSNVADPTHIYRNLTNAGNVIYPAQVIATTPSGCIDSESRNIEVRPYVNAKFTVDKVAGCSPLAVDAVATKYIGIPAANYKWTFGDGINASVSNPPAHTYPVNPPGGNDLWTLRLDVTDPSGLCSDFATKTITVYDEALADFTPKNSIDCNEYTLTFNSGGSQNAAIFKWDFDDLTSSSDPNPTHTFTNDDPVSNEIYNVVLDVTSDEGCTDAFTSPVSVYSLVVADFDVDVSEGCSPLTVTISNNSVGTEFYWFWDKDDYVLNVGAADSSINFASFNKIFVNNSGGTRTDSLTLIVRNGNGCYDIFKRAITIHSTIDAQFTVDPVSKEGCNPLTVNFTNTTVNGTIYNWTFGDGSSTTAVSPKHEFINTLTSDKTFRVRLDAKSVNGCTDYLETDIKVYSKVISDFSIETSEGCPPFTTSIDNTSIGNVANTYEWFIDNISVTGSPTNTSDFTHLYDNVVTSNRDYEVKLIASNSHGCTSEHKDIVRVYEYVEASFSMDKNNSCTPLDVVFTDLSAVPASTKYIWNFGDGATSGLTEPTHRFYNSSRTTDIIGREVKLTVQSPNYCTDDTTMTVDIFHQPLAKFFIDKTSSCPPLVSTLVSNAEGEDSFEWRFGDGTFNHADASLSYSWPNTDIDNIQIYNLELWVGTNNGCKDSTSLDLTVFPKVIADFTISDSIGCSPLENVQFTNASTSPAKQFFWSFGDGTTSNIDNPTHDFANVGSLDRTYDVFFKASSEYNCWDTITKQVTVYVQPDVEFYADPVFLIFPDNVVAFDNKTNSGPFDYLWEFGNLDLNTSDVEEPGSFEYEHWGEKIVELSVTSKTHADCFDYYSDTIMILPPKVNADFVTDINGGCLNDGLEVQFTAAGSVYNEDYHYDWEFGDGEIASGQYVNHMYKTAGVFYVRLTARSNEYTSVEEDYAYKTIRVYSNPVANFEASPTLSMLNTDSEARVEFFNMSECNDTSGCAYAWNFGDGETSISRDVTHNYTELGTYDISLIATTAHGCIDSLTLYQEVEIIGAGEIAFPNAFTPNNDGLNDTFRPVSQGVIKYELLVYNRWGELIFTTKDLSAGWDGTVKGKEAKPDVYVWKAEGNFTNGRSFEMAGDVTLIK